MDSLTQSSGPRSYPTFVLQKIQNPNKLYAIPLFGLVVKFIMLIPVFLFVIILEIGVGITVFLINPFVVLFTGKYWPTAYELATGFLRYGAKVYLFMAGLSDKYPGFDLQIHDEFKLDFPMPQNPNKLYAIPLFGLVIRGVIMIPYFLWVQILIYGSLIAVFFSFFSVLVNGQYPQVSYEFVRDTYRVNLAAGAYMMGISDTYPSFWISFAGNKLLKILLVILGAIFFIWHQTSSHNRRQNSYQFPTHSYSNYQNQNNGNTQKYTPSGNSGY